MNKYLKEYLRNRRKTLVDNNRFNDETIGIKHYEGKYFEDQLRGITRNKVVEVILDKNIFEKYFLNQTTYKNIDEYDFYDKEIKYILSVRPEYFPYFKDKMKDFSRDNMKSLLFWSPQLISKFDLTKFSQEEIEDLVLTTPRDKEGHIIKHLQNKVPFYHVTNFIRKNPDHYMDFIELMKSMDFDDLGDVYFHQPEILKHMSEDDIWNHMRRSDAESIIEDHPHMEEFFKSIDFI